MIGVGVIGYGYWGPNLARNFSEAQGCRLMGVSDLSPARLEAVLSRYPSTRAVREHESLLADPAITAIAIATPVSTHFRLALQALRAGKHVLVEKPLATSSEEVAQLIQEASDRGLTLMVDHTFIYTGAVRKMKQLVEAGQLGKLYYYDSVRVNLGLFQHDVNVLWDLAVHDLAIMEYVLSAHPSAVSATAVAHVPGRPESMAYLTCFFPDAFIAHFHVNWLAPVKIRRVLVGGDRQMILYDDVEPSEKIKIYDRGVTINGEHGLSEMLVGYRTGDVWAPQLNLQEALGVEVQHFLDCVNEGVRPLSDGESGLRVVGVLEAAAESIRLGGTRVPVQMG